jgi:hypothetical protein
MSVHLERGLRDNIINRLKFAASRPNTMLFVTPLRNLSLFTVCHPNRWLFTVWRPSMTLLAPEQADARVVASKYDGVHDTAPELVVVRRVPPAQVVSPFSNMPSNIIRYSSRSLRRPPGLAREEANYRTLKGIVPVHRGLFDVALFSGLSFRS